MCLTFCATPLVKCILSWAVKKSHPPPWAIDANGNGRTLEWQTFRLQGLVGFAPVQAALKALDKYKTNIVVWLKLLEGDTHLCFVHVPGPDAAQNDAFVDSLLDSIGDGVVHTRLPPTVMTFPKMSVRNQRKDEAIQYIWSVESGNCYQSTFTSKALFEKSKPPYWSVSNGENLRTLTWRTYKIEGLKDVVPLKKALEALPKGTNLGVHLRPYEDGNHICYFFQPGEHTEEADAFYEKLLSIPGWGVTYSLLGDTEMIWPIIIAGHCPDDQFLFDMWSYGSDEHQVTGMRTLCGEDLLPVKMRRWRNRPFGKIVIAMLSKLKYQRKRNPWDYY